MIYLALYSSNIVASRVEGLSNCLSLNTDRDTNNVVLQNLAIAYTKQSVQNDKDQVITCDSSALIGRIFDKNTYKTITQLEFKKFSQKLGLNLIQNVWGKYVYWNIAEPNKLTVLVDPTGQLPCFYYALPGGDLVFSSHIHLIQKYIGKDLEYNWKYLQFYLTYGNSSSIQTPFRGVSEIPPGCMLSVNSIEREVKPFSNPFKNYKKILQPQANAVDILQSVMRPMIEPYENICVSLSGGLDSSSLTYCLSEIIKSDQKLSAINYYNSSIKSSNELSYARKVCEDLGIPLKEIDTSGIMAFDPYTTYPKFRFNKPFPSCISLANINELSRQLSFDTSSILIDGHGSDHIFMRHPTKRCITDYWLTRGTKGFIEKLNEISDIYRDSFIPIINQNIKSLLHYLLAKKYIKSGNTFMQDQYPSWLNFSTNQCKMSDLAHPVYLDVPSRILPGKYDQINLLYEGLASIHVEPDFCYPAQYPFFSEPVVNFALSFQSYDLFKNGFDRYPLRKSVSSRFHTDAVWRRDKGQVTGNFQLGVKKNINFVMELCLEGELVKQGLVDKEGLYKTILLISNGDHYHIWHFIHVASIEIFLKMWSRG